MEIGKQTDCIFTDFSKAFDRLPHNLLCFKLIRIGFPRQFVFWIASYLSGRFQQIQFRGCLSRKFCVKSGVPQGSHLGPLFFVLFINDVGLIVKHSKLLIYADDLKLFRTISSLLDCAYLAEDLCAVHVWCINNFMLLNISKCAVLSFHNKKIPLLFNYTINESFLSRVCTFKDLGVILDSSLSFVIHINSTVSRANSTLGFIKRWSRILDDVNVSKALYTTLVRPILEYASIVWNPFYVIHKNRIESVQRRFLRFALNHFPWEDRLRLPPYALRLRLLRMNTLCDRRTIASILFIFKCFNNSIDSPHILRMLKFVVPSHSLRRCEFLRVDRHRTNYGASEPINGMRQLFNLHYDRIDFSMSVDELKSSLWQFFLAC